MSGLLQRLFVGFEIEFAWFQELLNNGHGILQRIAATAVFVPIGFLSLCHLRNMNRRSNAG
jgi:hypothetical protein